MVRRPRPPVRYAGTGGRTRTVTSRGPGGGSPVTGTGWKRSVSQVRRDGSSRSGGTAVPRSGRTAVPRSGRTAVPRSGRTAVPRSGRTAVPRSGRTAAPSPGPEGRRPLPPVRRDGGHFTRSGGAAVTSPGPRGGRPGPARPR
ncbi:hypothetical protein KME66_25295 [Streptomyces sp. YPW6]|nr:hypothetical protein KME66_25295 [Streptomyces sp. YPW6]